MKVRARPHVFHAVQLGRAEVVLTSSGDVFCSAGDWVLTAGDGKVHVCRGRDFARRYELVDGTKAMDVSLFARAELEAAQ